MLKRKINQRRPVLELVKVRKRQFPNGRVITVAPELGLLLSDKQNPYKDGKFPFVILKDHDIAFEFWGKGEIEQLMSPQKYINELSNQIIDNAKNTANMPWIMDKNAGIGVGKITNRPGIIIRKNPGSEVRRDAPPPMPGYVSQQIEQMKYDIETISGVHDVTQGRRPTGIQAGNAIMALQEAGQARIRVKIKLMEEALSELSRMWYSRMKQFWVMDRYVRIVDNENEGDFKFVKVNKSNFEHEFDIKIKSGSTMQKNKASMLDLYIRLAQTSAEDGLPMIDRESVLEYTPIPNKREVLKKFEALKNGQMEQQMQQTKQAYDEQQQAFAGQIQQIGEALKQTNDAVKQLSKQMDIIIKEHDAIKLDERLTDAKVLGYEQGVNEIQKQMLSVMEEDQNEIPSSTMPGLTVDEAVGMGHEMNEDTIQFLNSLAPQELAEIIKQYPDLQNVIMTQETEG